METTDSKKLKRLQVCTMCYIELLNIYLKTLNEKSNFFQMYNELCALDWQLAKIFEQTYNSKFDLDLAIRQFHELKVSYAKAQEILKLNEITNIIMHNNQQNKAAQSQLQAKQPTMPKKIPPSRQLPPKPKPRPAAKQNDGRDL